MSAFFSINYIIKDSSGVSEKLHELYSGLPLDLFELNIFDLVGDSESKQACKQAQEACNATSEQVTYVPSGLGKIYNDALRKSTGSFINFCDTDINLTSDSLKRIKVEIETHKKMRVFCFTPYRLDDRERQIPYFEKETNTTINNTDNFINLSLQSYFWKNEVAHEVVFNENVIFECEFDYIIRILANEKKYHLLSEMINVDFIFEFDFYNYPDQYYIEWYNQTLRDVYLPLAKAFSKSPLVRMAICYLVELRFACNRNNRNKNILADKSDIEEFFKLCAKIFSYIDNLTLTRYNINEKKLFPKYMSLVMLKIKYKDKKLMPQIIYDKSSLVAIFKKNILEKHTNFGLDVKAINCSDGTLVIDGEIVNSYIFDRTNISVFAKISSKKIELKQDSVYSLDKYFGITMKNGLTGSFVIPLEMLKKKAKIAFYIKYEGCTVKLPVKFVSTYARLSNNSGAYWNFNDYYMSYNKNEKHIFIKKRTTLRNIIKEVSFYKNILCKAFNGNENIARVSRVIGQRLLYWVTKPYYSKRKIWITFDQLFKGGDNGEYFFRYVNDHHKNDVDMYYIINKNSDDSIRLKKKYRNVIDYNSVKSRIITMHASCVFGTRVEVKQYCGFSNIIEEYFRDLLNYKVLCLQHGLTIQQIAEYQNRILDNTQLYFCVSRHELTNLQHPVYGYKPEQLLLTGAPRYDGLESKDERQILIAPTWRRNVTAGTNRKGEMHSYSVNFKDTEYFRIYNGLINDKRLIECAKRCGYRLIYLIHPILSPQINDFDRNDYVEIMGGASGSVNYEKMLSESSLMVTDHSGIQYDFAFMKKPLVYYHPDALPAQYEAKTMDYETMGFGPVCKDHEAVVDEICSHMENECRLRDEYARRIDDFFAYTDRNNCKRVYEALV